MKSEEASALPAEVSLTFGNRLTAIAPESLWRLDFGATSLFVVNATQQGTGNCARTDLA